MSEVFFEFGVIHSLDVSILEECVEHVVVALVDTAIRMSEIGLVVIPD